MVATQEELSSQIHGCMALDKPKGFPALDEIPWLSGMRSCDWGAVKRVVADYPSLSYLFEAAEAIKAEDRPA